MSTLLGALVVGVAGLLLGSGVWPIKVMTKFQFEQWWFIGMLVGLIILPWTITLLFCPHALAAYWSLDPGVLLKANIFAVGWGIANILCALCFVRIGFALTGGILTGLGISVGVTIPMFVKGSGLFHQSPDWNSPAGRTVLIGVAIILVAVPLVSMAGFGRDRVLGKAHPGSSGGFRGGLIMAAIAGVLSAGLSFSFVYSQGPILEAMKARGAGDIPANFAVWSAGLLGGALINVGYPAYLMTKRKSWNVLTRSCRELLLAALIGINLIAGMALMGKGMLLLGALGASVGFGIQQALQVLGSQGVGFISGEWRGVHGRPRIQMYLAITILILATLVMAYGNTLAKV